MKPLITLVALHLLASFAMAEDYSLTAPDGVHSRERIEVGWTAPEQDGALLEIRADPPASGRASYAYVRNNPQAIEAPEPPGDYRLLFIVDREVRASHALTVYLPEASLEAPERVGAGETFEVRGDGPENRGDTLTFAARGGARIRGASYAYLGNSEDGTVRLTAPVDAGEYDVIYLSGSTILARAPVAVHTVTATLTAPAQVHAGGQVRVRWEGPRNDQDYIGFAQRDGDPIRGASYSYVANHPDNRVVLTAREQPGPLDLVYVSGGRVIGRTPVEIVEAQVAIDAPEEVVALDRFEIHWSGMANSGDQIRLVDGAGSQLAYRYVDPQDPVAEMTAPEPPGTHHLVYVTREGRELARRPIRILPPPREPGELRVVQTGSGLAAQDAVAVIFDASGSMLQRLNGQRRVEIARRTLTDLVSETLPQGTGFALRVFGHKEPGACRTDLEYPLAPLDRQRAEAVIAGIEAMNLARTPLARSIELSAGDLAEVEGQRILVVLTDGEETCDGDPAAAIRALRERGWDVRVNIVGFAIDDEALRQTFSAWASLGGGAYFNAGDADELGAALVAAVTTEFRVVNADGETVARSSEGEGVFTLPAGDYRIVWGGGEEAVSLPAGGSATATLAARN